MPLAPVGLGPIGDLIVTPMSPSGASEHAAGNMQMVQSELRIDTTGSVVSLRFLVLLLALVVLQSTVVLVDSNPAE